MHCLQDFLFLALVFPFFPGFSYPSPTMNCLLQGFLWCTVFLHSDYMPCPLQAPKFDKCYLHIFMYVINVSIISYLPSLIILYGAINLHSMHSSSQSIVFAIAVLVLLSFLLSQACHWVLKEYLQSGPKKCIRSLLINIFGINLNEISISG